MGKRVRKSAQEEEKKEEILLLCTGFSTTSEKKKGYSFLQITEKEFEDGELSGSNRPWTFAAKGLSRMNVTCGVFRVQATDSAIFVGTSEYVGMWKDREYTEQVFAERKVRQAVWDANKRYDKDKSFNHLKESLTTARKTYHKLPGMHKHVFLAMVVSYITGFKP